MSVKAVPVMRVAMAAAFVASAMVQAVESAAAATELVREAYYGEEKEGDTPPHPSAAQPHTVFSLPSSFA
jgi:hypothetical protein